MTSFLKRLSRSRSNSQSYVDSYDSRHDSKTSSNNNYDDGARYANEKYGSAPQSAGGFDSSEQRPNSSRQSDQAPQLSDPLSPTKETGGSMYARQTSGPQEVMSGPHSAGSYGSPPVSAGGLRSGPPPGAMSNGYDRYDDVKGGRQYDSVKDIPSSAKTADEPAHNMLLQAFNTALRPYNDKVETLENEIQDLRAYIDQLEAQRGDVHAWIDKRGLRPGKSTIS